jgi:isocitrate dehydrogenase
MTNKIAMATPLVEMDGDEMTRILWAKIKEYLLTPYIDLKTEYYDLGLANRNDTRDAVTTEAAEAIKKYGVGVKCATITPNKERMKEYGLAEMYRSPNGTIREILDGTIFRAPILVKGIVPFIQAWSRPITVARHAHGDVYKNTEVGAYDELNNVRVELVATLPDGEENRQLLFDFSAEEQHSGVVQGIYNTDESITSFARCAMNFALETKQDLWFAAKDTISKIYDRRFRDVFENIFKSEYEKRFEEAGITYFYTLIDDAISRVIRSEGGFIWACKNYDGDVMSDMVAAAYGSLAMMTSVLLSPDGYYEYEASHGTVQKHYYQHLEGKSTSTNSMATIYAWTGALRKRGELDGLNDLVDFAAKLELAAIKTIEDGIMTGDLYALSNIGNKEKADTETFLQEIRKRLSEII